jgi:hypothetical protein
VAAFGLRISPGDVQDRFASRPETLANSTNRRRSSSGADANLRQGRITGAGCELPHPRWRQSQQRWVKPPAGPVRRLLARAPSRAFA